MNMKIPEREKINEVSLEISPAYWPGNHGRRHGNRKEKHKEILVDLQSGGHHGAVWVFVAPLHLIMVHAGGG